MNPETNIPVTEVKEGDYLVGENGGLLRVSDVQDSSLMPGCVIVVNEFGLLYFDSGDTVGVIR